MRPDLDDYEELNDPIEETRSRTMSWLVLGVAVTGFAALAYYAYHSGTQTPNEGDMLVVQADETPIKEAPVNAEGEQFPNKDKTIYDVIAPAPGAGEKVEKLLPDPEHPVVAKDVEDDGDDVDGVAPPAGSAANTTTYVAKSLAGSTQADPVDVQSMKQGAPAKAQEVAPAATPAPAAAPVVTPTPAPVAAAPVKEAPKAVGEPTFVNEKPAKAAATPAAKPAAKEAVAKPAAKEVKTPASAASSGDYKVQLGAFKSEAEAREQWKKISGKFGDVLRGSPIVVKADLPNGTFYRLRTGGFASADAAKAVCAKLSGKGQACIPAGK